MSQGGRVLEDPVCDSSVQVVVDIGPTDPDAVYSHFHVVGVLKNRVGDLGDLDLP